MNTAPSAEIRDAEAERRQMGFFPRLIPPEVCARWVAGVRENDGFYVPVYRGSDGRHNVVDKSQRNVKSVPTVYPEEIQAWVRKIVVEVISPFYKAKITRWEPPQLLRYEPGGFYSAHFDSEVYIEGKLTKIADRDYSLIVFLNTDFTGGGLDFPEQDLQILPEVPGGGIVFPSGHRYPHGVHPVEQGLRYSLVTWMAVDGPA